MFLRFIERKGWLKFNGRCDYLRALFDAGPQGRKSFYQLRLCPLFFEGLAVEGKQRSDAIGEVPFLNGGLFDRSDLDERVKDIPDRAFSPIIGPDGLFYRFNFTVEESTPLDIEVAVDPEMLGKVFEELVTGRHETGSYYTPRPIVSFMCREALKGVLAERLASAEMYGGRNIPQRDRKAASAADLDRLSKVVAPLVDEHNAGKLSESQARELLRTLDDLKAVDPACGSGAYLLGLLQELVAIYRALFSDKLKRDSRSLYDLKLRIISQNLYGVDIDPFAISIAMLRLWLSLAVEADEPIPLPNLDFKIEIGDSLLGPNPEEGSLLQRVVELADVLVIVKRQYFLAHGEEKTSLLRTIKQQQQLIREALHANLGPGIIDWRIEFAEAFAQGRGGFDIVLANPPYGVNTDASYADTVDNRDSFAAFIGLAKSLARRGSSAVYIVPTSWETGERFADFRKWFFSHCSVETVVNLPYDVFDIPFVDTAIVLFRPFRSTFDRNAIEVVSMRKRGALFLGSIRNQLGSVATEFIKSDKYLRLLMDPKALRLFEIVGANPRLGAVAAIKRGIEAYKYEISTKQRTKSWLPYFQGNVYRFTREDAAGPAYVEPTPIDREWHLGSRLLIRRLVSRSNRLMACQIDHDAVVKKDLYVLKAIDTRFSLRYLLGLLNASLLSYLYLTRSASAQKDDFRQVTLAGLRDLPLPQMIKRKQDIENVAAALQSDTLEKTNRAKLEEELDSLVFDEYGIPQDVRREVADYLAASG
jgi:hypothetical protein